MKYLKKFELYTTGNELDYNVGDTVVCNTTHYDQKTQISVVEKGQKYKVLKIYSIPEDKFLKNPYLRIDIQDENGKVYKGFRSDHFKHEIEYDTNKYNL